MRRNWHIGILVLAALAALPLHAETSALQDAQAALQSGNAASAESLSSAALDTGGLGDHERASLLLTRGLARQKLGNRDDALVDFTIAIETHAFDAAEVAQASYDRGALLDEMGRTDDAIGDYTAAIDLSPGFVLALKARAADWRRENRIADARRDEAAAIKAGQPVQAARANAPLVLHPPGQDSAAIALHPAARHAPHPVAPTPVPAAQTPGLRADIAFGPPPHGQIQLGAWRTEAEATQAWSHILAVAGPALDGLSPHVVSVDIAGKGRYYRLRAGPVTGDAAIAVCGVLHARGLACLRAQN